MQDGNEEKDPINRATVTKPPTIYEVEDTISKIKDPIQSGIVTENIRYAGDNLKLKLYNNKKYMDKRRNTMGLENDKKCTNIRKMRLN